MTCKGYPRAVVCKRGKTNRQLFRKRNDNQLGNAAGNYDRDSKAMSRCANIW